MARKSVVSKSIYRRHLLLIRHLNNAWIFSDLLEPHLKGEARRLRNSKSREKRSYPAPRKSSWIRSGRRDRDVGQLFQAQLERGVFETNITSMVSKTEAFIQDCVSIAARAYPQKLSILAGKGGVPIELVLDSDGKEDLITRFVSWKCDGMMFSQPRDYLKRASKVLSIDLEASTIDSYLEIKASRDVIVHGKGVANKIYVEKAGNAARAEVGQELEIDKNYFKSVVVNLKILSGEIQRKTEEVYK